LHADIQTQNTDTDRDTDIDTDTGTYLDIDKNTETYSAIDTDTNLFLDKKKYVHIQPIADRVAQNLVSISKKNSTNQISAHGIYD